MVSPEAMNPKKPEDKRPRTSKQPEEWVEVPLRKDLEKKKPKPALKKTERPKRGRSDVGITKTAEGVSYAAILKNLKVRRIAPIDKALKFKTNAVPG